MSNLPNDPVILLSYINTQLRDNYSSLAALCDDKDESLDEVCSKLATIGYAYDPQTNRFV